MNTFKPHVYFAKRTFKSGKASNYHLSILALMPAEEDLYKRVFSNEGNTLVISYSTRGSSQAVPFISKKEVLPVDFREHLGNASGIRVVITNSVGEEYSTEIEIDSVINGPDEYPSAPTYWNEDRPHLYMEKDGNTVSLSAYLKDTAPDATVPLEFLINGTKVTNPVQNGQSVDEYNFYSTTEDVSTRGIIHAAVDFDDEPGNARRKKRKKKARVRHA